MLKRLFIFAQWMVVLFLFISLLSFFFRNDPKPETQWRNGKTWSGFYALSIEGVADTDNPRYLTPSKLDEVLAALNEHGYTTITSDDVAAYYYDDAALPEKAVLLMFEGGRKDHVVWATPRLIKNRMVGLLCVPTEVTERWGNHFIDKSDLRRIARHPNWRLASMGHDALSSITVDASDNKGRFLSRRSWLRQGHETDTTFEERVTRDYRVAMDTLVKASSRRIAAYLYMYGDPGEGKDVDPLAATINQGAVRQFHQLAFTQEGRPFNSHVADPYALSRMRVRGDWSVDELLQRLQDWAPSVSQTPRWHLSGGTSEDNAIRLQTNGSALLGGSDFWSDLTFDVTLDVATNAIGAVYVRYSGPHAFLRVSVHGQTVRVQEKRLGKLQTLAMRTSTNLSSTVHQLTVRLKNNRIWVTHDEDDFARSVPISRQLYHGHVWVGAEGGDVVMSNARYEPLLPLFLLDGRYHQLSEVLRSSATALLPSWVDADRLHPLSERRQIDVMRAARDGIQTIPVVTTRKKYGRADARELALQVAGIFNMPSVKMLIHQFAITGYDPELSSAFRDLGYQTVYILSVSDAEQLWQSGIKIARDEMLLVAGDDDEVEQLALRHGDRHPPRRVALTVRHIEKYPAGTTRVVYADHR